MRKYKLNATCSMVLLFVSYSIAHAQTYTAPANINFVNTGNNSAFTTQYVLINTTNNLIAYVSSSTSFSNVGVGTYTLRSINFDPNGSAPSLSVGTNFNNIGGTCVAASSGLTVTVVASSTQTFTAPASFSFNINGNNTAYSTQFVLVDSSTGIIKYASTSASFNGIDSGTYSLYAVNFNPAATAPVLTVGTSFSSIGGSCIAVSSALTVIVNCQDNPSLPNYSNVTTTIQASNVINATNIISSGANVTYKSGGAINLNAGFEAQSGSIFVAQISGCNN